MNGVAMVVELREVARSSVVNCIVNMALLDADLGFEMEIYRLDATVRKERRC